MKPHLFLLMLATFLLGGCGSGSGTIQLKGIVTKGAEPVRVKNEDDSLELVFLYADADKQSKNVPTAVDSDGAFTAQVPADTDLKIVVVYVDYNAKATDDDDKKSPWDRFKGDSTPLAYKTTTDFVQEIQIDLKKNAVTRK